MEKQISSILSKARQQAGDECIAQLSKWNLPLIMAASRSKGSGINVSQMVAVVGQQIIGSQRVQDGFQYRTLPHFPKNAPLPPSKGFVRNSNDDDDDEGNRGLTHTSKIIDTTLRAFISSWLTKYKKAQIDGGCGCAVNRRARNADDTEGLSLCWCCWHKISITQSVPRIKEIINASKEISTPVITCKLVTKDRIAAARIVNGRIN